MSLAGMVDLPLELLIEITSFVAVSTQDVRQLRCVDKTFHRVATPVAFKTTIIHTTDKSTRGFLNLLNSSNIVNHVRDITLVEEPFLTEQPLPPETVRNDENVKYERVINSLKDTFAALHRIPALESLTFYFTPNVWEEGSFSDTDAPPSRFLLLQWHVLGAIAHNPNPLPTLQSLTIHKWLAIPHSLYSEAPFTRIVASLRHLRFMVDADDHENADSEEPFMKFWCQVVKENVLQLAVNLESLDMDSSLGFGHSFDFSSLSFPRLTALSLTRVIWEEGTAIGGPTLSGVENFVARHGKTLRKLELRNCAINVQKGRDTPIRCWAAVWNQFANELTELVNFVADFRRSVQYVYYDFGFVPIFFRLRGTEDDAPALAAFEATIEARRK